MSKLNAHLSELVTRLHASKPPASLLGSLELAHARLSRTLRDRQRSGRLRELTEDALRGLAKSLDLDSWSDDASNGVKILSITGKIIVVDIAFDAATSQCKSCTLVLATQDGLQDEIVVDGRDKMTTQLLNNQLDDFARSLEKLAFLDKHSEPSTDLNLFNVQDTLREAFNRRLASSGDSLVSPISSTSHLDLCFTYHPAQSIDKKESKVNDYASSQTSFSGRLEIEEQPVSAHSHAANENGNSARDWAKRPVLRYPRTWIDGSKSWLPTKQFLMSKSKDDLRYALILEPPIIMPLRLIKQLVNDAMSRLEWEPSEQSSKYKRLVHAPDGPHDVAFSCTATEELATIHKIAFSHPKELELILAHARQHVICQQLRASLTAAQKLATNFEHVVAHDYYQIKQEYVEDEMTAIDDRQAISLSIFSGTQAETPLATIQVLPNHKLKCWHSIDEEFFRRAIDMTQDIPIALIATGARPAKSAPAIEELSLDDEPYDRMDFRRDPQDRATRVLTATEAKQGYNYVVPVEPSIEMKTTSSTSGLSPTNLAQIGKSLRSAFDE